jgi:hypothetical protein
MQWLHVLADMDSSPGSSIKGERPAQSSHVLAGWNIPTFSWQQTQTLTMSTIGRRVDYFITSTSSVL